MTLGKIITLEDKLDARFEAWVLKGVIGIHGAAVGAQCVEPIERGGFAPAAVCAEINRGRWIVRCHTCSGAQLAYRTRAAFWCMDCLSHRFGGSWVTVVWPDPNDATRIERLLMERPDPAARNWLPHETIDDLVRENRAHGLEGVIA